MNHQEQSNSNPNSGLLRFRSAPSSLFSNSVINCDEKVNLINNRSQTHFDSENLFLDLEETKPNTNGFSLNSQLPPQYPKQSSSPTAMGTNLMRQSSSPAGLYSHITAQNGYAALRGIGNYRVGNDSINGGTSPSSCRLRSSLSFSSGLPSSLGMLSQISENDNENINGNCNENIKLGNRYLFGGAWNDSSHFPDNFSVFKRDLENDGKLFSSSQNGEIGNRKNILSHHLSLPKTSAEMAVMEKLLHFQDTVPCKVRAKRGCATHPRSIAERVRRTRISERMRKLQELVPNMDKQTNTAEMLDLAVEYIKELQKQYKVLSENRAKCKCSSMQKPLPNLETCFVFSRDE